MFQHGSDCERAFFLQPVAMAYFHLQSTLKLGVEGGSEDSQIRTGVFFADTGMRKHNFIKLFKMYKQQDTETIAHFPLTVTIEIRGEGENDDLNLRMDVFRQTQIWKKITANTKRQLDTTAYFPLSVNIEIRGELLCLLLLCGRNLELLVVHEEFHSVRKAMLRLLAPSLAHTNSLFRVYASTGM